MFDTRRQVSSSGIGPGPNPVGNTAAADGWGDAPTKVRGVLPNGLDTMAPGPELAAALATVNRSQLNGYELIILVGAERRQVAHYEASSFETITELAHCPPGYAGSPPQRQPGIDEYVADELRAALVWTRRAAETTAGLALDIVERFPVVLENLKTGIVDLPKARTIVNTLSHLEIDQARVVADQVIDTAPGLTTGELGARLRRLAIQSDPQSAAKEYKDGLEERRVVCEANPDGTANLSAYKLPVLAANQIMRRIHRTAQAAKLGDDPRTIDQVRADVFTDLLLGRHPGLSAGHSTSRGVADIRVDLTTLAGLNDNPGEVPGWGPVMAEIARQAADGPRMQWQTTVVDEHGDVLSVGTIRRRPTTGQHRRVTTQIRTCIFPGCRMPATQCDIDHNQRWADGGKTEEPNLAPECRHDHILKDKAGWKLKRLGPYLYQWTSRHGHTYTTSRDPP